MGQQVIDAVSSMQLGRLPQFVVAFQPIIHIPSREVAAYEALMRGSDGSSYPQLVADMDEETLRLFHRVTAEEAVRSAVALGIKQTSASLTINLLPDLHPDALNAEYMVEIAERCGMPLTRIVLELTEDHKLSLPQLNEVLTRNRLAGFATAMDDFGSGYSGLTALVSCHPDVLKLDRQLVTRIDTDEVRQTIVGATVKVAASLNMRLVAEGVENAKECQALRKLGVRFMQGYFLGRPVTGCLSTFDQSILGRSTSYLTYHDGHADHRKRLVARDFQLNRLATASTALRDA
jgi:EAL domain-containing protein (putative c-di-GMP-specific phosphodiesterase class I)